MMKELEHLSYEEALVLLSPEKAWHGEAQGRRSLSVSLNICRER